MLVMMMMLMIIVIVIVNSHLYDCVTLCGNKHWSHLQFAGYFDVAGEAAVEGSACTRAHLSAESIVNHSRHRKRIQPAMHAVK